MIILLYPFGYLCVSATVDIEGAPFLNCCIFSVSMSLDVVCSVDKTVKGGIKGIKDLVKEI